MDPTYLQAKLGNAEQTSLYWTLGASATVCRTGNAKFFLESLYKEQKALGGFPNTLLSSENSTTIGNFTNYKGLQNKVVGHSFSPKMITQLLLYNKADKSILPCGTRVLP